MVLESKAKFEHYKCECESYIEKVGTILPTIVLSSHYAYNSTDVIYIK